MNLYMRLLWLLLSLIPLGSAIGSEPVKEFIGGVGIPIPTEMTKATENQLELMIPGFKGGQIALRGGHDTTRYCRILSEANAGKWQDAIRRPGIGTGTPRLYQGQPERAHHGQ